MIAILVPVLLFIGSVAYNATPVTFTFNVAPNSESNAFTDSCELRDGSDAYEATIYEMNFEKDIFIATAPIKWQKEYPGTEGSPCIGDAVFSLQRGKDYFFYVNGYPTAAHLSRHEIGGGKMRREMPIQIIRQAQLSINLYDIAVEGCQRQGLDWECKGLEEIRFNAEDNTCSPTPGSQAAGLLLRKSFYPFEFKGISTDTYSAPSIGSGKTWKVLEGTEDSPQPVVVCTINSEFELYDDQEGYEILSDWGITRYTSAEAEAAGWHFKVTPGDEVLIRE